MKKLKLRYKILLFDVVITIIYWFAIASYLSSGFSEEVLEAIDKAVDLIIMAVAYCWVNVVWLFVIFYGLFSKRREVTFGGLLSLIFSLIVVLLFFVI